MPRVPVIILASSVLVFAGCSQLSLMGSSSKEKSHHIGVDAGEKHDEVVVAPSDDTAQTPKEPGAPVKREENFVAELATKNMDLIVSAETIGNQEEVTRINSFLRTLAAKTESLGPNLRRVYLGNFSLETFPDVTAKYETSQTVQINVGTGLPTLAAALAAKEPTVTPRANSQLAVVIITASDTTPVTFDADDDGNPIPIYPEFTFPQGTQAFGLLKINPLNPQVACGTEISTNAANVVQSFSGRSFDLCDSDVDTIAGYVAYAVAHRNRIFQLKSAPSAKVPVEVFVNDQRVDPKDYSVGEFSWAVEFNASYTLKAGDKVKVIYQTR